MRGTFFKKLLANKLCFFCGLFIVLLSLLALFAETLAPYSFDEQFPEKALAPPSLKHWIGTDHLGRDLFSRLLYGTRMSMAVGVLTALISSILGTLYGLISGWFGGLMDRLLMRLIDILSSIPILILLILTKTLFDTFIDIPHPELRALAGTLAALSLASWASLARVVRGQTLQVKEQVFVESARALGAGHLRLIFVHVLPNISSSIIVLLSFQIPSNILFESILSFLGLGLEPPFSSWGVLADEAWRSLSFYPRLIIAPGIMLFLSLLSFNLFGDGLRDILDPKMQKKPL